MLKTFMVSGSGGQGVISIGTILASIFMLNDMFVSLCSSYGAEMRGGAVNCEINMSDSEILSIQNEQVDYAIALNQLSFDKFISRVKENGIIIVNSSLAKIKRTREDISYIFAPLTEEAIKLGNIKTANSIALGILSKIMGTFPLGNVRKAYEKVLKGKNEIIQKNIEAYMLGMSYSQEKELTNVPLY